MRTIKIKPEKTASLTLTLPESAYDSITKVAQNLSEYFNCDISKNALAKELVLDAINNVTIDVNGQAYTMDQIINREFDKNSNTINVPGIEANNENVEIINSNPEEIMSNQESVDTQTSTI